MRAWGAGFLRFVRRCCGGHALRVRIGWLALALATGALGLGASGASGLVTGSTSVTAAGSRGNNHPLSSAGTKAAIARDQAALTARERWLQTPSAQVARLRSQTAFRGLDAASAESLLVRQYGGELKAADASPAASIAAAGKVVRYLGDYHAIVVRRDGKKLLYSSTVPLRTSSGAVDLRLKVGSQGFSPARDTVALSIGADTSAGVTVGPAIRVVFEGASSSGRLAAQNSVFYPNVATDTDAVDTPTANGVDLSAVLRSRLSPEVLRYSLVLPRGTHARVVSGTVVVYRGSRPVAVIQAPSATDAQGTPVPVLMSLVGHQLVLSVRHRGLDIAYPVLVDPQITVPPSSPGWSWTPADGGPPSTFTGTETCPGTTLATATSPGPGQVTIYGGNYSEACGGFWAGWNWSSLAASLGSLGYGPLGNMTYVEFDDMSYSYQDPENFLQFEYSVGPTGPDDTDALSCALASQTNSNLVGEAPANGTQAADSTVIWEGTNCGTNLIEQVYTDSGNGGSAELQVGAVLVAAPLANVLNYVALGDSYSSGEGLPPYLPGTDGDNGDGDFCHRSDQAYPALLSNTLLPTNQLLFYACSGATTSDIFTNSEDNEEPQGQQPGVDPTANLVTMTIGGNDAGFSDVIWKCMSQLATRGGLLGGWLGLSVNCADSPSFTASVSANIDDVLEPAEATYQRLVAQTDPLNTSIIVADYPHLFPDGSDGSQLCAALKSVLSASDQNFLNGAADQLDGVLQSAAEAAGVNFVDVRPYFEGHGICGNSGAWVNGVSVSADTGGGCVYSVLGGACLIPGISTSASFHPNAGGQAGYAQAIEACINGAAAANAVTPEGMPANPAPDTTTGCGAGGGGTSGGGGGSPSIRTAGRQHPRAASADAPPPDVFSDLSVTPVTSSQGTCEGTLQAGQAVNVSATGFLPGTPVTVYSEATDSSTPEQQLASVTADLSGAINTTVTIPAGATGYVFPGASAGMLFLDAIGLGANGVSHADAGTMQGLALPASGCGSVVSQIAPSSGSTAGGTPVTITGSDLSSATGVSFGTTPAASFTVDSESQITAVSPLGSGSVDVTVDTPQGPTTTSTADQFTYTAASAVACPPPPAANDSLKGHRLAGKDLRGANLAGYDLQGDDLAGANLQGANLTGANLDGDDVRGTNLRKATLTDATLQDARLQGSNLQGVAATCAGFAGATMRGDSLRNASFENATFAGADLRGSNLQKDDLTDADLANTNLRGADLRAADLAGASLYGATTQGANLRKITWSGTYCPDGTDSDAHADTCVNDLGKP